MRKKSIAVCEGQLSLFDLPLFGKETEQERFETLRHISVDGYRTKTIKAGNLLEVEVYPLWDKTERKNAKSRKPTKEQIRNQTHRRAEKRVNRLINHNFREGDLWATFGYDDEYLPSSLEQVQKDVVNFVRRLKRAHKRENLPELRYLYVIEYGDCRPHVHMVLSGDLARERIEGTWGKCRRPHTRQLDLKSDGALSGIAYYITKGNKGKSEKQIERLWAHSQNLEMPPETVADKKITKRKVEKFARNENYMIETLEKLYPQHKIYQIETKTSAYCAGVYIYAQMTRRR